MSCSRKLLILLFLGLSPGIALSASLVREAAGADAASIQATVDQFRTDLGTLNPNNPVSLPSGRREINWDGVPDGSSSPNAFPGNFFNGNVAGRARGIEFNLTGPGSFEVSANAVNPTATPVEFGNLDATHPARFGIFSAQKLFGTLDNTIFDVHFFVPGTTTPAFASGFGAVFTDVNDATATHLDFFDASDNLLLSQNVLPGPAGTAETLSFLGVSFTAGEQVARVRVTAGNQALNQPGTGEVVAMDDFIYGEPQALSTGQVIPLPPALLMGLSAALPLAWALRCRITLS